MLLLFITQVLSISSVIIASVYFGSVAGLCSFMATSQIAHPNVVVGNCNSFQVHVTISHGFLSESMSFDSRSSVGWILALSFLVIAYQGLAMFQLCFKLQLLNRKKVFCRTIWTVFSLMVCFPPLPIPQEVVITILCSVFLSVMAIF